MSDLGTRVAPEGGGAGGTTQPGPWYRRKSVLVTVVVAAILAVTIITDLPAPDNRASDIATAKTVISQVKTDVSPCANAVGEAFQLYSFKTSGTLSDYERANAPEWLSEDVVACSFANPQVFDLSDIQAPGTASGKQLDEMLSWATVWATSDALNAMNAIQTLMSDPTNAKAAATLRSQWQLLGVDRNDANSSVAAAETILKTTLPSLGLPPIPEPVTASPAT